MIDDDVAGLSGGLRTDDALGGDNFSGEGGLVFVGVGDNCGLIVVRRGLKEVLLEVQFGAAII